VPLGAGKYTAKTEDFVHQVGGWADGGHAKDVGWKGGARDKEE
jgi:hypothetical protein